MTSVRLPIVGGDDDAWGTVLNDYLAALFNGGGTQSVLQYGADPTGVLESTAAFNQAISELPTITTEDPNGVSHTLPYGTITLGGRFKLNQSVLLDTFGPWVTVDGLGWTSIDDHSSASLTGYNGYLFNFANTYAGSSTLNPYVGGTKFGGEVVGLGWVGGLLWWMGGIKNCMIDGTNTDSTSLGAIKGGAGEYFQVKHCLIGNYINGSGNSRPGSGACAIFMDSHGPGWVEAYDIDIHSVNNASAVIFNGKDGSQNSQGQGHLRVKLVHYPGQSGIVMQNGAWCYNTDFWLTGVMISGTAPGEGTQGVGLVLQDPSTLLAQSMVNIKLESDGPSGTSIQPQTIFLDKIVDGSIIRACHGSLQFQSNTTSIWQAAHPAVANGINSQFSFWGLTQGDATLSSVGVIQLLAGSATGA